MKLTPIQSSSESTDDFPRKVQLQTISSCNYKCTMCPYPTLNSTGHANDFDIGHLMKIIEELRDHHRAIDICIMLQNEPFLDASFIDYVDLLHGYPNQIRTISTVTNGSLLSSELLYTLEKYNRFNLTISVNATNKQQYLDIHKVDRWHKIQSVLHGFNGQKQRIQLSAVAYGDDVKFPKQFVDYWSDLGYSTRISVVNSRTGLIDSSGRTDFTGDQFSYCHYPLDTLTILQNGETIICCNDWEHATSMGNVFNDSIYSVWNSCAYRELRKAALSGDLRKHQMICSNCDYPTSSSRMRIYEDSVLGEARSSDLGIESCHIIPHQSIILFDSTNRTSCVTVIGIDPETKEVFAICESDIRSISITEFMHIRLRLKIGVSRFLAYSELKDVYCRGRLSIRTVNGLTLGIIALDNDESNLLYFNWYYRDWANE